VRARAGSVDPDRVDEALGADFTAAADEADALAAGALVAELAPVADALALALLAGAADALVLPLLAGNPGLAGAADAAPAG
jgi:hypothetical protein